jgi:hypothetical protein
VVLVAEQQPAVSLSLRRGSIASPPDRRQFPPRDQLPAGIGIEKIPILGTTWYERGPRYWLRRVWLFLAMALVVTLTSLLVGGFLIGIKGSSHAGYVGMLIAEVVWSLVIIYALLPEYPPEHKARLRLAQQLGIRVGAAALA